MKRRMMGLVVLLVLLAGVTGVFVGKSYAKQDEWRITSIPAEWGQCKGARGDQLIFENSKGVVRLVAIGEVQWEGKTSLAASEVYTLTRK